uniref:Uncharacterized protein n=1 Tax=Romanomermis culicivorax TaxID=13658 RepID=A0A915KCQ4_ROMCU
MTRPTKRKISSRNSASSKFRGYAKQKSASNSLPHSEQAQVPTNFQMTVAIGINSSEFIIF